MAFIETFARITRMMTANITGYNVIWSIMSNAPRDLMTMFTYSEDKNPSHILGGILSAYVNKVKGDKADPLYKEYLAMGGGQTSAYTADKNLQKNVYQQMTGDKLRYLNPMEWLEWMSDLVESGPRFAYYRMMRQKGMTPQEAFYASCDITVNFRRGGKSARGANKVIPFFNAGVQGVDKFCRWVSCEDMPAGQRKKAAGIRAGVFAAVSALLAAILYGLNHGDEEKEKAYGQLSTYNKNSFWCIPLGGGRFFTISKPREITVLESLFERLLEQYGNDNPDAMEGFYEYATNAFLPNAVSSLAQGDVNGALGSLGLLGVASEINSNKDFLGRPIVSKGLENMEPRDQYTRQTSKLAFALGQVLNYSPQKIDHIAENTLGGFWKWQEALFPLGEEYVDLSLGIGRSYVKDSQYSTDIINRLYDARDAAQQEKNSHPQDAEAAGRFKLLSTISVGAFLAKVNEIAAEGPKYRLGGYGRDKTCDCIGLTIGAIRRAGGVWKGTHGSNYAARYEIDGLGRTSVDTLFAGQQVFKAREKGHAKWKLPNRYWNGADKRDYYHAGVVTSVAPLRITHSTGTGLPSSIKVDTELGAWGWGGKLKKVGYDETILPAGGGAPSDGGAGGGGASADGGGDWTGGAAGGCADGAAATAAMRTAIIHTKNGRPLHIRAQPTKACGLYWDLPHGTKVDVLETDTGSPGWWKIRGGGVTGYCWTDYLSVG